MDDDGLGDRDRNGRDGRGWCKGTRRVLSESVVVVDASVIELEVSINLGLSGNGRSSAVDENVGVDGSRGLSCKAEVTGPSGCDLCILVSEIFKCFALAACSRTATFSRPSSLKPHILSLRPRRSCSMHKGLEHALQCTFHTSLS